MAHPDLRRADHELLAACEVHTYRASGPGGQHRNKVESAVRMRHVATGVSAIAEESRSQHENRRRALRRLREAIALRVRSPVELERFTLPPELLAVLGTTGRLRVREENPHYPVVVATLLDLLAACDGEVSRAARLLGNSTHHLTQFLAEHARLWQEANRIRRDNGRPPLRKK